MRGRDSSRISQRLRKPDSTSEIERVDGGEFFRPERDFETFRAMKTSI